MSARIVLTRPREWFGRFRKLGVLLDGEVAASLGIGATVEIDTTPGRHTLQLQMDWCTSPIVVVDLAPKATARYRSRSPTWWRAPGVMRRRPHDFFGIELVAD